MGWARPGLCDDGTGAIGWDERGHCWGQGRETSHFLSLCYSKGQETLPLTKHFLEILDLHCPTSHMWLLSSWHGACATGELYLFLLYLISINFHLKTDDVLEDSKYAWNSWGVWICFLHRRFVKIYIEIKYFYRKCSAWSEMCAECKKYTRDFKDAVREKSKTSSYIILYYLCNSVNIVKVTELDT